MNHQVIEYAIGELLSALKKYSPPTAVHFTLEVSHEGHNAQFQFRDPEDLKESMVSMRNLSGDFIKKVGMCGARHPDDPTVGPCRLEPDHTDAHYGLFRDKQGEWDIEDWPNQVDPPDAAGNILTKWTPVVNAIKKHCVGQGHRLIKIEVPDTRIPEIGRMISGVSISKSDTDLIVYHCTQKDGTFGHIIWNRPMDPPSNGIEGNDGPPSEVEKVLDQWSDTVKSIKESCARRNFKLVKILIPDPVAKGIGFAIDGTPIAFCESGVRFLHRSTEGDLLEAIWE